MAKASSNPDIALPGSGTPAMAKAMASIKKRLAAVSQAHRATKLFEDCIYLIEAALRMQPAHLHALRDTGAFAEDPQDIKDLFASVQDRYGAAAPELLAATGEIIALLHQMIERDPAQDVLGALLMDLMPNENIGQYFTPPSVTVLMARLAAGADAERLTALVYARIREAIAASEPARTLIAERYDGEEWDWVWRFLLPMIHWRIKPVTVYDPAVGSAALFCGLAAQMPQWMNHYNLVKYYGQDIDLLATAMAKINLMLRGMNGYGLNMMLARSVVVRPESGEIDYAAMIPAPARKHVRMAV